MRAAVLKNVERFNTTVHDGFGGRIFHFDVRSIRVFDPLDAGAIRKVWPQLTRLGQAKWSLDPERYEEFEQQLTGVESAGATSG